MKGWICPKQIQWTSLVLDALLGIFQDSYYPGIPYEKEANELGRRIIHSSPNCNIGWSVELALAKWVTITLCGQIRRFFMLRDLLTDNRGFTGYLWKPAKWTISTSNDKDAATLSWKSCKWGSAADDEMGGKCWHSRGIVICQKNSPMMRYCHTKFHHNHPISLQIMIFF